MDRRRIILWCGVALGVLLMLIVATGPVVHVWEEPPPPALERDRETPPPDTIVDNQAGLLGFPAPKEFGGDGVIEQVVVVLILGALLFLAANVILFWIRVLASRQRRVREQQTEFDVLPGIAPTVDLDVEAQRRLLADGPVRNAIVACWRRMEDDVAEAGVPRMAAETSSEYTLRVIAAASVDPGPISELAALYREARFSDHEMGDAHRRQAIAALERIDVSLRSASVTA